MGDIASCKGLRLTYLLGQWTFAFETRGTDNLALKDPMLTAIRSGFFWRSGPITGSNWS